MSLLTRLLPNAIFGTDSAHTKHGEKNICTETPPPKKMSQSSVLNNTSSWEKCQKRKNLQKK